MATIRDGRISTTFNYNKIKAIPELSLLALTRTHSGGVPSVHASSITSSIRMANQTVSRAEPCFVTKQHAYSVERTHFVNAVRHDEVVKTEVELFLQRLGIVKARFTLNSASNVAPLLRDLHYTLDKFGFFAITCSKTSLEAMITEVDNENTKWQAMASRQIQYKRTFFLDSPPFSNAEYEMVVLNAQHFLPRGAGFLVHEVEQGAHHLSHNVYVVAPDGALRAGRQNNDRRLPPFTGPQARAPGDALNPFLVIINAEIAFRRFRRNASLLCQEFTELIDLTIKLAEKIYFQPLVDEIEEEIQRNRNARNVAIQAAKDADRDLRMDEFRAKTSNDKGKTTTQKDARKFSRTGRVVERPGRGASHDRIIEYRQYLMSGRDHELNSEDGDLLEELDSQSDGSDEDDDVAFQPVGVTEKVHQWRDAAQ